MVFHTIGLHTPYFARILCENAQTGAAIFLVPAPEACGRPVAAVSRAVKLLALMGAGTQAPGAVDSGTDADKGRSRDSKEEQVASYQ